MTDELEARISEAVNAEMQTQALRQLADRLDKAREQVRSAKHLPLPPDIAIEVEGFEVNDLDALRWKVEQAILKRKREGITR